MLAALEWAELRVSFHCQVQFSAGWFWWTAALPGGFLLLVGKEVIHSPDVISSNICPRQSF